MTNIIGLLLCGVFLFLSGLHFYWGLGGKWALGASVPTKENGGRVMNPKVTACFVVAMGLLAFALLTLVEARLLVFYVPTWLLSYGLWALAAVFFLRAIGDFKYVGFFKKIRNTPFGRSDTKYYSPLCLMITILSIVLALIKPGI